MNQNDPLLPFTLNSAIVGIDPDTLATFDPTVLVAGLPKSADTEVVTTAFAGNASKQLTDDLELTLRYRYYDYDNRSPRVDLPGYVRFHSVWEEVPRVTVPYEYSRDDLGLELDWAVSDDTDLIVSYHQKGWDREFREIEDSDEDVFEVALDTRPSPRVGIRASWQMGDRTTSEYRTEAQLLSYRDEEAINQNPDVRKFDEAAREFDDYSLQVRLFPDDRWSLVFGISGRDESYDESILGLIADDTRHYNGEVAYTPSAALSFFVFGDIADRDSLVRSRRSGSTPSADPLDDWQVGFEEANDTWGLGLTADTARRLHWEVSANWSDSDGKADFSTPVGGNNTAEDIEKYEDIELLSLHLKLTCELTERASIGFTYLYEDYTIDSFNLVGLQPYLPSTLLLAAANGDYQADVWGLRLKLKI